MTKPTRPDAKHASVTTNTAQWRETGKTRRKAKLNKNEAKPTKCGAKLTRTSGAKLKTTSPNAKPNRRRRNAKPSKPQPDMPSCPSC